MEKGLYEKVIDAELQAKLAALVCDTKREGLDVADSHTVLASHLADIIAAVLRRLPVRSKLSQQSWLVNRLIDVLAEQDKALRPAHLPSEPEQLLAVLDGKRLPIRPDTPLSETSLLTGTRNDPSLLSQLKQELASADRVDILCSFIKWGGIGLLRDALEEFVERPGTRLRVLTTSYMAATDLRAVEVLAALPNTEVKVSYDTHRTRLHAKAYLFERNSGFSCAYVGSANLSRPALTEGLEWTMKVTQYADRPIWNKVLATFESYWQDDEFELYERDRLAAALKQESGANTRESVQALFDLRPYQFQQEVLDRLQADREARQSPYKQLVVAATGTGKTMIAAFDYRREVKKSGGRYPRLMVIAHRQEILKQTLQTFRAVLRDHNFGDLWNGLEKPTSVSHVFVTIQTLNQQTFDASWPADYYDYMVVDESHHSAAVSYQKALTYFQAEILLGLTATPERTDEADILRYFDDRIVSEIRLPDAINRRLVVPFHYHALTDTDDMDYSKLSWSRGGFVKAELDNLVTNNYVRAQNVVDQCHKWLADVRQARGLGFCVSILHAQFMAKFFNKLSIPAIALTSESLQSQRLEAQYRLKQRDINFIFTVDLYNEGVDLPDVDTVLFLRPTESLTVFLQQLGRGLRLTDSKDYLTVLDFVGKMHRNFRYDLRLRALSSSPKKNVREEFEAGFPHLPAGCSIQLDKVASQYILDNINQSIGRNLNGIVRAIKEFHGLQPGQFCLSRFLDFHQLQPDDIYKRGTWNDLCWRAEIKGFSELPSGELLAKWLRRIAHANDSLRLQRWRQWLEDGEGDDPFVLALLIPLIRMADGPQTSQEAWALLHRNKAIFDELQNLISWRLRQVDTERHEAFQRDTPLVTHAAYTRDEILVLTGLWSWEKRPPVREGVRHVKERKQDLFFTTINKDAKHYSPSTLYEDYAINSELFHWQSQSTTADTSPTGQRYIHHQKQGYAPLLFVRTDAKLNGYSQAYQFLGELEYQSHSGSRPMSIIWKLKKPISARLCRDFRTLTIAG